MTKAKSRKVEDGEARAKRSDVSKSRWAIVIADRFDWMPDPSTMVSGDRGRILFLPEAGVAHGVAIGALERIEKPQGYSVDKSGRVVPG